MIIYVRSLLMHEHEVFERTLQCSVSQSFLARAPFSDKQISIVPLPSLAHIPTQFFCIVYLGCLKMIGTRMSAKMHFTIKLNLVN